ncbi:NAD+ synthase [Candidatus Protochlamydia phocaeensis]|uniref:NAD+ synthase n=1 Tax=Candidatus Protochlamydia phocaeensis TaxID=1414722 RepID=UPI000838840D|nr:NAD+ synthase [Candidatus Protochlamydia phocaeensis]
MRILLAQINPIIGDLAGNTARILQSIERGKTGGADIVLLPELALSGYPPEDFLLLPSFMEAVWQHLNQIVQATQGICAIVGLPRGNPDCLEKALYNSAAIIQDGQILGFVNKTLLPTYDVFDERRYFEPGGPTRVWSIKGESVAVTICEDLWQHSGRIQSTHYKRDPVLELKDHHPSVLLNLSASPYSVSKFNTRLQVCLAAAKTLKCPIVLCNQVGGNDSLIFDGYSLVVNESGLIQCAKGFKEDDLWIDLAKQGSLSSGGERHVMEDLYQALVLGVHDYFHKLGFKRACLGLSGGIDSALVACIAAEALGPENVLAINMPSRFSSPESARDSAQLAKRLGMDYKEISIEAPFESYLTLLAPYFAERPPDITEENLQARIRGMLLMAFSNKFGYIVLSTGNKSELAMGYATLYGDMCGGLGVINDLTKQQVYALSEWINRHGEIIPWNTIRRPPSAELRPNQKDSDSLPDYQILDRVLQAYVEEHHSAEWIAAHYNYPLPLVQDLIKRIHQNEYKRRQAPPGLRVSEKAFSIGRRFPIVQRWVR